MAATQPVKLPLAIWVRICDALSCSPDSAPADVAAKVETLMDLSRADAEQLTRLRDWKESAMTLLARYDGIAETFGGKLGSSKLDNLERGVERLRKAAKSAMEWIEASLDYDDVAMDGSRVMTALRKALSSQEDSHE